MKKLLLTDEQQLYWNKYESEVKSLGGEGMQLQYEIVKRMKKQFPNLKFVGM